MTKSHKKTKSIIIALICVLMLSLTTMLGLAGCSLTKEEGSTLTTEQQAQELMDGATANLLSLDHFKVKETDEEGEGVRSQYFKKSFNSLSWYSEGTWCKVEEINNKKYLVEYELGVKENTITPIAPYSEYALYMYASLFMNYEYFLDSAPEKYEIKVELTEKDGTTTIFFNYYEKTDPTVKLGNYNFAYKKVAEVGNEYALVQMGFEDADSSDYVNYEYDFADGLMPSTDAHTWVNLTPVEIDGVFEWGKEDQPIVFEQNENLRDIDLCAQVKNSDGDTFIIDFNVIYPKDYMVTRIYSIEGLDLSYVHSGSLYIHIMDLPVFVVEYSVFEPTA